MGTTAVVTFDVIVDDDFPAGADVGVTLFVVVRQLQFIEVGQVGTNVLFQVTGQRLQGARVVVEVDENEAAENFQANFTQAEIVTVKAAAVFTHRCAREQALVAVRPAMVGADDQVLQLAATVEQFVRAVSADIVESA